MVQLVEVMLPGEDGPVGEHLGEDAADGPDVDGLGVALQRERDRDPATPCRRAWPALRFRHHGTVCRDRRNQLSYKTLKTKAAGFQSSLQSRFTYQVRISVADLISFIK